MIRIFGPAERSFKSNGLQVIDKYVIDPQIHEELNGIYEFTFSIPISKSSNIERENIVVVNTPLHDNQAFRITQVRKEDGLYHVTCFHIFYDLIHNMIEDINIVGSGATNALKKINEGCVEPHPFSFSTDIIGKVANCRIVRYNPVQAIIGTDDNTFVNRWGGEIERNNFNVFMRGRRGTDKGIRIEYKKNLLGYECEIDYSRITTKIMPKGAEELLLPEKYIVSDNVDKYANTKIKVIEFNDVKAQKEDGDFESEGLPLDEAYAELRRLAQLQFDVNHIDLPRANYKVNFIDLSKTREYKHLKQLEKVYLGDTVHVLHKKENLDIEARVISYTYNPLNKRYIEIELGNFMEGLTSLKKEIDKINDQINNDIATALEEAKENATNLIKNGFGGHVRIYPDRILIMDNEDETQTKQVWQWNKNGFGYSNTGIDGQYGLAMTMDGAIVADAITTGTLNASLIKAGLLQDKNGEVSFDLDKGTFNLKDRLKFENDTLEVKGVLKSYFNDGNTALEMNNDKLLFYLSTTNTLQGRLESSHWAGYPDRGLIRLSHFNNSSMALSFHDGERSRPYIIFDAFNNSKTIEDGYNIDVRRSINFSAQTKFKGNTIFEVPAYFNNNTHFNAYSYMNKGLETTRIVCSGNVNCSGNVYGQGWVEDGTKYSLTEIWNRLNDLEQRINSL